MTATAAATDFPLRLAAAGRWPLRRDRVRTLQVNVGRRCDLACHHCHVDAGPKRTEAMDRHTAARVLALLARNPEIEVLDLSIDEALAMIEDGRIIDGKTIMLLQYAALKIFR